MTLTLEQARQLQGGTVRSSDGHKIGSIGQVYLDDTTGQPAWVTAKTGLFGTRESFVPLQNARLDGDDVVVDYDQDTVKNAPQVDPDGHLEPSEEDELYRYYRLGGPDDVATDHAETGLADGQAGTEVSGGEASGRAAGWAGGDVPSDLDDPAEAGDHRPDRSAETVGYDRSGPTTDDAMTRSEEQLRVGTQARETGRARLRKYVTTENVTQTVPVSHEEVRLEREPITDANRGAAESGPAISEEEHEVVLHAEQPAVHKEAVPVERVRLDTETVTEQATISDEVRKEQIDIDDPDRR